MGSLTGDDQSTLNDLEVITKNWITLATIAFEGFSTIGRGIVHVHSCRHGVRFNFYRDETVDDYDPEKEVLIMIGTEHEGEYGERVYRFSRSPTPLEAIRLCTASDVGSYVH